VADISSQVTATAQSSQDPRLAAELLTVHDLPTGWAAIPVPSLHASSYSCGALNIGTPSSPLTDEAKAEFEDRQDDLVLDEHLVTGTTARIDQAWKGAGDIASVCPTISIFNMNGTVTYKLRAAAFPSLGALARAFSVTATTADFTATGYIVVARRGETLMLLAAIGVGHTFPSSLIQQAVSTGVARAK
jgi:hypothetical protein